MAEFSELSNVALKPIGLDRLYLHVYDNSAVRVQKSLMLYLTFFSFLGIILWNPTVFVGGLEEW